MSPGCGRRALWRLVDGTPDSINVTPRWVASALASHASDAELADLLLPLAEAAMSRRAALGSALKAHLARLRADEARFN